MKFTFELETDEVPTAAVAENIAQWYLNTEIGAAYVTVDDFEVDLEASNGVWRCVRFERPHEAPRVSSRFTENLRIMQPGEKRLFLTSTNSLTGMVTRLGLTGKVTTHIVREGVLVTRLPL